MQKLSYDDFFSAATSKNTNAMFTLLHALSEHNFLGVHLDSFFVSLLYFMICKLSYTQRDIQALLSFGNEKLSYRSGIMLCLLRATNEISKENQETAADFAYELRYNIIRSCCHVLRTASSPNEVVWARVAIGALDNIPVFSNDDDPRRVGMDLIYETLDVSGLLSLFFEISKYEPEQCLVVSGLLRASFNLPCTEIRMRGLTSSVSWLARYVKQGSFIKVREVTEAAAWAWIFSGCSIEEICHAKNVEAYVIEAYRSAVPPACATFVYSISQRAFQLNKISVPVYVSSYFFTCSLSPEFNQQPIVNFKIPLDNIALELTVGYPWWDPEMIRATLPAVKRATGKG